MSSACQCQTETAAAKKPPSAAIDFLQEALRDGPMDMTECVRLGKEAGFSEKSLRTAREKLGVETKKEGFGVDGKWVWVPSSGATVLKLVVDNDPNKQTPVDDKQRAGSTGGGGDNQAADSEPEKPGAGADDPDGGNAA